MKKFYCQNCGTEVPLDADFCNSCGKEFGSVLCPKCGYSGKSVQFKDGCPNCEYSADKIKDNPSVDTSLSLRKFLTLFIILGIVITLMILQF